MPTNYGPRKICRRKWTQEQLNSAIKAVIDGNMSVRQAAKKNCIPEQTLRYQLLTKNFVKGYLDEPPTLGADAEKNLVDHIRQLQAAGFAPTQKNVRIIAFNLAEALGIKHKFNKDKEIAGIDWLRSFMKRNSQLSVRKAISTTRSNGMNRKEVNNYFEILKKILIENDLIGRLGNIYNMDEIGFSLNNEPGKIIAMKGSREVHVRKSTECGENVTIVSCCNAEGTFLPPYVIFKGVYKRKKWVEEMPRGSVVAMNRKSGYIDADIFLDWFQNHFIPRKNAGKCLLILDGHASHMNNPHMLDVAIKNDVILLCLPNHTTHYLQPLNKSFFCSLKAKYGYYFLEWRSFHPDEKLNRQVFGKLLKKAWTDVATISNGIAAFRATGIVPFDPTVIPEYDFLIIPPVLKDEDDLMAAPLDVDLSSDMSTFPVTAGPLTSNEMNQMTTETIMQEVAPIPRRSPNKKVIRRKQSKEILTNPDVITAKKIKRIKRKENEKQKRKEEIERTEEDKIEVENKKKEQDKEIPIKIEKDTQQCSKEKAKKLLVKPARKRRKLSLDSFSNVQDKDVLQQDSSDGVDEFDENECVECFDTYKGEKETVDWIECIRCGRWLHETCTLLATMCTLCGRKVRKAEKEKLKNKNQERQR